MYTYSHNTLISPLLIITYGTCMQLADYIASYVQRPDHEITFMQLMFLIIYKCFRQVNAVV